MIFISGIHGVGKSFFAVKVKERCAINTYTASKLISDYMNCTFQVNKQVEYISDNQKILLLALKEITRLDKEFLLDGHFCLLNENNNINRIEFDTYKELNPKAIILLTEEAKIITQRRAERDGVLVDIYHTGRFQEEEIKYAKEVAAQLQIPLYISKGATDINNAIEFIINNI